MYRTHHCNELRPAHIGATVVLSGWVQSRRDHGGVIFIDLRDREGFTQVVFHPEENAELAKQSHHLRDEDVIRIEGRVIHRLKTDTVDTTNANIATGEIEIVATKLDVLNKAEVLPFQLDRELSNEDLRMKYRYLDLRRARMSRNLRIRHKVTIAVRAYLDELGYLEIETPILSKSTPEGARDFLVPARLSPGNFYALPQAPQQYKQLLMVAGMEKYFQIARCFRDEDLRADRQPEFTQVDIESSFITQKDLQSMMEGLLDRAFQAGRGVSINKPFPVLTYEEAMNEYGSDKPDTRFGMKLTVLDDIFAATEFKVFRSVLDSKGALKAINAKGFACITTGQIAKLTEMAKLHGAGGLAFIKVENGEWKSPILKFFTETEKAALKERMQMEEGDLVLFGAGGWETVCNVLGRIRLECAAMQEILKDNTDLNFLWVVDFPLLAFSPEDNRWTAVHHPFTRPNAEDAHLLAEENGDYSKIRAVAYDVVLNGFEIGGGSLRIHERDLQKQLFDAIGVTEEEQKTMFGHILEAFQFGAPPHGGIALGLDRLVMLICGEESIREVIAFPKNNRGTDLMTASPSGVSPKQLRELYIQSVAKKS